MKNALENVEPSIEISARFWHSLTDAEWAEVCATGCLNAELCARLYRMSDRQNPPKSMLVLVKREDLERLIKRSAPR